MKNQGTAQPSIPGLCWDSKSGKAPDAMTCTEMNLFASKADLWHIKKLE